MIEVPLKVLITFHEAEEDTQRIIKANLSHGLAHVAGKGGIGCCNMLGELPLAQPGLHRQTSTTKN